MDENTSQQSTGNSLTWERVASSAIKQAGRHERALRACLAELGGTDAPTSDLAEETRLRAARHAERALSLTRTAIRLNQDPLAEAFLAALLERHERNALQVEEAEMLTVGPAFSLAG